MKPILVIVLAAALFTFGCQKQQTEAERNAEIERQVQQRLAAEHQAQDQQRLSQGQVDLQQRVQDLESQATPTPAAERVVERDRPERDTSGGEEERGRDDSDAGDYSTFYAKLEPEGDWIETSNYGYVWQPSVARQSHAWRPYTNGRWVYTDAGWTWISEEPFGWATYHYGRWTRLRSVGWIWVPGNEWAPAWVSWRTSNDYVGWAPLPPEARFERRSGIHNWADSYYDIGPDQYCFVQTSNLGEQRLEHAIVPSERNLTIVNQTVNVTNITYSNTTVINNGPNYDEVRRRTQQPIERLRLERQASVNVNVGDLRPVVRGEVVQMQAPVIARAQRVERPRTVRENIAQPVVERGWDGIPDRQAAEQAREKIRSEATPPPSAPSKTFVRSTEASFGRSVAAPAATAAISTVTSTPLPPSTPMASPRDVTPRPRPGSPAATTAPMMTARPTRAAAPVVTPSPMPRPNRMMSPAVTPNPAVTPVPPNRRFVQPEPSPRTVMSPAAKPVEPGQNAERQFQRPQREEVTATPTPSDAPSATPEATSPNTDRATPEAGAPSQQRRPERQVAPPVREKRRVLPTASPAP